MKKIVIGIGVVATFGLFLFVGSAYYLVNYVARPEQVRALIVKNIEQQLPGSTVTLKQLSYDLFPSIKLKIGELNVVTARAHIPLIKVHSATVHIPILNVLKGGGQFLLKIDAPDVFYTQVHEKTNWEIALGRKKEEKHVAPHFKQSSSSQQTKLVLPSFLLHSFLNVKISNTRFRYNISTKQQGSFIVEKLTFKHLGFLEKSAFEIVSTIDIKNNGQRFKVHPILIGTLNVHEILMDKKIKIPMELKLLNLELPTLGYRFPLITTHITLNIDPQKHVSGKFNLKMLDKNRISFLYDIQGIKSKISNFNLELLLSDFQQIFKLPLSNIEVNKTVFFAKGDIYLQGKTRLKPKLEFGITKKIVYRFRKQRIKVLPRLWVNSKTTSIKLELDGFKGKGILSGKIKMPTNLFKIDLVKLKPINMNISLMNMQLPASLIRSILYATKKIEKSHNEVKVVKSQRNSSSLKKLFIPNFTLVSSISDSLVGKIAITHQCHISFLHGDYNFKKCILKLNEGIVSLSLSGKAQAGGYIKTRGKSKIKITKFSLAALEPLLPENTGKILGIVEGRVTTSFSFTKVLTYNSKFKFLAMDGQIEKLNLNSYIMQYKNKLSFLKKLDEKDINLSDSFERFSFAGKATEKSVTLQHFNFIGLHKKVEIKGKAKLFPFMSFKGVSEVQGAWKDRAGLITHPLKKYTGKSWLPFLLKGENLLLQPQYDYTIKRVGKSYIKNRGKKELHKVLEKSLGKKAEKLLKNKKVKKLLQGLFD